MFNSTLMEFNLDLLGVDQQTSDGLQGYSEPYAQHMENDKKLSMAIGEDSNIAEIKLFEETSDLKALFDIGALPEDNGEDVNVEKVINEVEEFLQQHGDPMEDSNAGSSTDNVDLQNLQFDKEEMDAAENLLDELLRSDVSLDLFDCAESNVIVETPQETAPESQDTQVEPPTIKIESQNDSGFFEMSNVTQVVTEDGQHIVIMIAPPSPGSATQETSKATNESVAESDNDSEWIPETRKGRPVVKRSTHKKKRSEPYITDKKERKKRQNVEAARRYRDKKKAEQSDVETEESILASRNKILKGEVAELEAELKTMKKLMTELGILK